MGEEDAQLFDTDTVWDPRNMLAGYASGAQMVSQDNLAGLKVRRNVPFVGVPPGRARRCT